MGNFFVTVKFEQIQFFVWSEMLLETFTSFMLGLETDDFFVYWLLLKIARLLHNFWTKAAAHIPYSTERPTMDIFLMKAF